MLFFRKGIILFMNTLERANQAMKHFVGENDTFQMSPFGNGHINDTYMVEVQSGAEHKKLILQRINHEIFRSPESVMENIEKVTTHLRKKIAAALAGIVTERR